MIEFYQCLVKIMRTQKSKDTLDLLAYSVGYLEKDFPVVSHFLDFILMADKRVNSFNLSLGDKLE